MNHVFVSMLLGKSAYETSMTDLLDVFEVLTDTDKLINFDDIHGLIIVGFNPDLSGEAFDAECSEHQTNFGDPNTLMSMLIIQHRLKSTRLTHSRL